ncbi:MAG: type II toxin-antitoxin system VapC family toxin [Chloroflexota bacterium]|nr:type II toxin-antitoxin system VapC family toxin [Chloroflexota bacterium]
MILLDTHVLVWLSLGQPGLGRRARGAIDRAWTRGEAAVSAITFWEAGLLQQKGRLTDLSDIDGWRADLLRDGLVALPVDDVIATRAGLLTDLHGDPADRLILATALEGHQLVTADVRLLDWPGAVGRLDARE